MKTDSVCSSCALTTTSVLPTHSTKPNPARRSRGNTLDPIASISWTSSLPLRTSHNSVLNTSSFHNADCNTDHALVGSKVKLQPKKMHHSKRKCRPCMNAAYASVPALTERYLNSPEQALHSKPGGVETKWSHFRYSIYNAAMTTFGNQRKSSANWFETHLSDMEPAIEPKRQALLNYKKNPNVSTLSAFREQQDPQRKRQLGNAPMTIGKIFAAVLKCPLTPATSDGCMRA